MNYLETINHLNSKLYEEFDLEPANDGYYYNYYTNGYMDVIDFAGVELFNSEIDQISELTQGEFESLIEYKLQIIGSKFLKYSKS